MTRHQLEQKTLATVKSLLNMPRKKMGLSLLATRARFGKEMEKLGYTDPDVIYRAWHDVCDIAELELSA